MVGGWNPKCQGFKLVLHTLNTSTPVPSKWERLAPRAHARSILSSGFSSHAMIKILCYEGGRKRAKKRVPKGPPQVVLGGSRGISRGDSGVAPGPSLQSILIMAWLLYKALTYLTHTLSKVADPNRCKLLVGADNRLLIIK